MDKKLVVALAFVLSACVTVNIYFPAAAVQRAADKIVEESLGEPKAPEGKGEPHSGDFVARRAYALFSLGSEAFAQEADINVSNPAIRALRDSIKGRAESVKAFLDKGNIGLSNAGLLTVRTTDGLNLKERAEVNQLVDAQNRDLDALYTEIARANNFPKERIADIKRIFAKSWADHAKSGWWVQDARGNWSKK